GNTLAEAQVQCLSEIFERAVKREIIEGELALPDVPQAVLERYPGILAGIRALEEQGFPVLVKDASLGGQFPVMCVTLMNPRTGRVFASFGAHPNFEVALERSLTELLQGRSFEGLNDLARPTFESQAVTEPNNYVEHFIDSSGVISWRFFSSRADYEFVDWDFTDDGRLSNAEMADELLGILAEMGHEVYMAVYRHLGGTACRILVPGYSEVYPVDDLIWDNTNKALYFREDILNLHRLDDEQLQSLVDRLEESELDHYGDIITLIGVEFDENTVWGQLTILELKLLIHLALGNLEPALELVEEFLQYNDNTVERGLFYQAMQAVLEVVLDDELELEDFEPNFRRMFGDERMDAVIGSVQGSVRFHGLTPTSMNLEGLERHQRMIDSLKKLHRTRARAAMQACINSSEALLLEKITRKGHGICPFLSPTPSARRAVGMSAGQAGGDQAFIAFIQQLPIACILTRLSDSAVVATNPSFDKLFGWPKEMILESRTAALPLWLSEEQRSAFFHDLNLMGSLRQSQASFRCSDGRVLPCLVYVEQLTVAGELCRLSMIHDISDRIKAEEALRRSEAKFTALFMDSPEPYLLFDKDNARITEINRRFTEVFGYTVEDAIGKTALELGLWRYPERRPAIIEKL